MKLIAIIAVLLGMMSCQAKREGYIIKGELAGAPENEWVFLMDANQRVYLDSVQLKQGRFEFRGKVEFPELRNIMFYKDPSQRVYGWSKILCIPVYVENSVIQVSVPFAEMPSKADKKRPESLDVKGSVSHDLYSRYVQRVEPLNLKYNEVFERYRKEFYRDKGTEEDVIRSVREIDALRDSIFRCGVDFIREHGDSPVALYVAEKLAVERYGRDSAKQIISFVSPRLLSGEEGMRIEKVLSDKPLYINDMMPDFVVLDTSLQEKRLSESVKKGRYTLIEFWASWCKPCRHDIPHLKKTFKRFHDKGFDIVSISIDSDTSKWIKAVEEEKMPWIQVCAPGRTENGENYTRLFGVSAVPSGFLIDPEGKVVHMTARGGWLNGELIRLLGE